MFVVSSGCLGDGDAAVHGSADSADSWSDTARSVERNHVLPEPRLAETSGYYRKDSLLLSIYLNIRVSNDFIPNLTHRTAETKALAWSRSSSSERHQLHAML